MLVNLRRNFCEDWALLDGMPLQGQNPGVVGSVMVWTDYDRFVNFCLLESERYSPELMKLIVVTTTDAERNSWRHLLEYRAG